MHKVATLADIVIIGQPGQPTAQTIALIVVNSGLGSVVKVIKENSARPSQVLLGCAIVECHADLSIDRENSLRWNGAFAKQVVGIVGDLFQTKRDEKISDPKPANVRNLVHRQVGVFHVGGAKLTGIGT